MPSRLPRYLSLEETNRLFQVTGPDGLLLEVLYATGGRVSEIMGLTWADVDLDEPSVRLQSKGGDERLVPIGEPCARALRAAQNGQGPQERVFPGNRQWAWRRIRALGRRAGIPNLHPHMLRHAFASHQLNRRAPLPDVSEMLGHKSWQTTADYYWHVADPRLHAMLRCIVTSLPRAQRYLMAHPDKFVDLIEGQIDP